MVISFTHYQLIWKCKYLNEASARAFQEQFEEQAAEKRERVMSSRCYLIPVDEEIAIKRAKFRHEKRFWPGMRLNLHHCDQRRAKVFDEHHLPKVGASLGSEARHQRMGVDWRFL